MSSALVATSAVHDEPVSQSTGCLLWYLNDACVPRPQKCEELHFGERNWRRRLIVAIKRLTAEEMLEPLDVLAARYPVYLCDPV